MGRLTAVEAEALQKDIPPQLTELAETIGKKGKRHGCVWFAHR